VNTAKGTVQVELGGIFRQDGHFFNFMLDLQENILAKVQNLLT
jgi:hypothetical protein